MSQEIRIQEIQIQGTDRLHETQAPVDKETPAETAATATATLPTVTEKMVEAMAAVATVEATLNPPTTKETGSIEPADFGAMATAGTVTAAVSYTKNQTPDTFSPAWAGQEPLILAAAENFHHLRRY